MGESNSARVECKHDQNLWLRNQHRIYCDACASNIELCRPPIDGSAMVPIAVAHDRVHMWERDEVFVDIETTGLLRDKHEIIQIGAVVRHFNKDTTAFKCFVTPTNLEIAEKQALEINGYSPEAWAAAGAIPLKDALRFFRRQCLGNPCVMLAWNPTFDEPFIRRGFAEHEGRLPKAVDYHWLDVASMAWPLVKSLEVNTVKLDRVCEYLGISNEGKHDAGRDVERMIQVYDKLKRGFRDYVGNVAAERRGFEVQQ